MGLPSEKQPVGPVDAPRAPGELRGHPWDHREVGGTPRGPPTQHIFDVDTLVHILNVHVYV